MTTFDEAARIAQQGYPDIKAQNMMADVQRELPQILAEMRDQARGYWTCPECGESWPTNDHGFAVTCACDSTLPPENLLRAGRK